MGSGIIAEGYNVTPPDLRVDITATSPLQSSRCSRSDTTEPNWTNSPEPPADITRRFWGCSAGTSTVRLISDQTVLASTTVTVVDPTPPPPPSPPPPTLNNLTATGTMTTITLSWTAEGSNRYEVSKLNDDGDYVVVASIVGSSYTDSGPLTCRTEHTYRVRTQSGSVWGPHVTKTAETAPCACVTHNLVDSDDADNILAVRSSGTRLYGTFERAPGRYPQETCSTTFREDPYYAVLYRFRTTERLHLRSWLRSSDVDPTIVLVNSLTGAIIEENDISSEHGTDSDAQIARVFPAGDYTIEVAIDPPNSPPTSTASYSLVVFAQEVMSAYGHQSDHVVQYTLGDMPETGTIEATLFPNVIHKAAERWDSASTVTTPKVRFCKKPSPTVDPFDPPDPAECQEGENDDDTTVVVKITGVTTMCDDPIEDTEHPACADISNLGGHMTSDVIYIEHPTNTEWEENGVTTRYPIKWHNTYQDDLDKVTVNGVIHIGVYLRRVAMHEFGHPAGLKDLDAGGYPGFLMSGEPELQNVPSRDLTYLKQVYRNDHGASPA